MASPNPIVICQQTPLRLLVAKASCKLISVYGLHQLPFIESNCEDGTSLTGLNETVKAKGKWQGVLADTRTAAMELGGRFGSKLQRGVALEAVPALSHPS